MEIVSTNLGMVKEAYQKFSEGDIASLLDMYRDDAVYQFHAPSIHPLAGDYEGKPAIARFFQMIGENIDLTLFAPQEFIDGSDKIVVIGREGGTSKRTGKSFEGAFIHVVEAEDGKLKRLRLYPDTSSTVYVFSDSQ